MKPTDYTLILAALARHVHLTEEEETVFTGTLEFRKIGSKKLLLREGDVCKHSAFVVKGCLRSYSTDEEGAEHILGLAAPGWWMADMYSLISGKPGTLNIEAVGETEVFLFSKKEQEKLYLKIPKLERFFRILMENALVANQQRLMDNLSLTAKERYLKFCKTFPGLIDKVSQKHVASYIGVTPEFLSKMKRVGVGGDF